MERKTYSNPEIDVLCVESDVITQESYNETTVLTLPRLNASDIPG